METLLSLPGTVCAVLATAQATSFGLVFLPLAVLVLLLRARWLLALVPLAAVMQAPAVVTLALGESRYGVTPFNAICALVAVDLARRLATHAWRREPLPAVGHAARIAWLCWTGFFAVSVAGALLLPLHFSGIAVYPAMVKGMSMPWTDPLVPSLSNPAQAINSVMLWALLTWAMLLPHPSRALRTFGAGLGIALAATILAGLHQRFATAGWVPWFLDFWASNPGYNQWFFAPEYGPRALPRVGLPFIEPSYASVWFAAIACGALAWALYGQSRQRLALAIGALAGVGLFNTLGTSGMFAAVAFVALLLPFHVLGGRRCSNPKVTRVLLGAMLAGVAGAAVVMIDYAVVRHDSLTGLREAIDWTWLKLRTYAGSERDLMNRQAIEVLGVTGGLGAGAGSTRASGYFHSLLANTGIAGIGLFFAAWWMQMSAAVRALRRGQALSLAVPAAAVAVLLGIASGIADQSWPVAWLACLGVFLLALRAGAPAADTQRPLRILLLTQWFDPEPTFKGIAFARGLAARGHHVEVITGFPNYPGGKVYPGYRLRWRQREVVDGIPLLRVPLYPSHDQSAPGRVANYLSFAASSCLAGLFLARRPDVVYAYHPPLTTAMSGLAIAWLRDVPLVHDIQDLWPDTLRATGMIRSTRVLGFVDRVCRFVYARATAIAVLSPGFRAALLERGVPPSKVEVIYNWADEQSLAADADPADAPPAMTGRFNLVFAGTMGKAQALDAVLEAAKIVAPRDPGVQFVFVGGGVEVERLKARVAAESIANAVFLPRLPMSEIGRVLHAADALLVHLKDDPLFAITVPSKTQAYMAVGRPVIMAVRGDAARLVQAAGAGLIVEPEQPEALAAAVLELAAMPPARRGALGSDGVAYYRRELSLASGAQKFEALFRRAIQDHAEESTHVTHHA